LIILIILGGKYKLWSSSLCSFLQPPVTSSRFGPNIPQNYSLVFLEWRIIMTVFRHGDCDFKFWFPISVRIRVCYHLRRVSTS
jgi:hypothetical protein